MSTTQDKDAAAVAKAAKAAEAEKAAATKAAADAKAAAAKAKQDAKDAKAAAAAKEKEAKLKAKADAKAAADKVKADAKAAKEKEKAEKAAAPKIEKAPKVEMNGVTQPREGTTCRQVWDIASKVSDAKKAPATRDEVLTAGLTAGLNPGNIVCEYGRWKKFYGLTRGQLAAQAAAAPATK